MRFDESNKRFLSSGIERSYRWTVLHNERGYRCGYICLPPEHPWYEKGYDEISVTCHGGLTYADKGDIDGEWWVGFDCAHGGDAPDPSLPTESIVFGFFQSPSAKIRTQDYVEKECKMLCKQAHIVSGEMLFPFYELHYGKMNHYGALSLQ